MNCILKSLNKTFICIEYILLFRFHLSISYILLHIFRFHIFSSRNKILVALCFCEYKFQLYLNKKIIEFANLSNYIVFSSKFSFECKVILLLEINIYLRQRNLFTFKTNKFAY